MSDFELLIKDTRFTAFTRGWVTRRLDSLADAFEFTYADLRTDRSEPFPIYAGDPCTIKLQGKLLLTGHVDDIAIQYDADTLTLNARGRSKTGDLVDCSAIREKGRWRNATLEQIVTSICDQFGIDVEVRQYEGIEQPFRRFAVEPGETAMDLIQRACRLRGVWATNTVNGGLLITRAGGERAPEEAGLWFGRNILQGRRYDSWMQRHSQYLIKGQVPSDDELAGESAAGLSSQDIVDDAIDRYRPLLIVSTGQDRAGDLRRRAQWERNRRAGVGERTQYRIDGYGWPDGTLWSPNVEVKVTDELAGLNGWQLISSVSYRFDVEGDDAGRATDLVVVPKEAFTEAPYPVRRKPRRRLINAPARPTHDTPEWAKNLFPNF